MLQWRFARLKGSVVAGGMRFAVSRLDALKITVSLADVSGRGAQG